MTVKSLASFEGSVLPNYAEQVSATNYSNDPMRGTYLRVGRVVQVHLPDSEKSVTKKIPEYDVEVAGGTPTSTLGNFKILRCRMGDSFGGAADFSRWTPRPVDNAEQVQKGPENLVLVHCINGKMFQGIIVGGVPNSTTTEALEEGHHYTWQFNGIRKNVDKDGQYTLSFKGATQANGTLEKTTDEAASGSTITLTKDGSIKLFTAKEAQYIHVNHGSKIVDIQADTDFKVTSNGTVNVTASKDVKVASTQGAMSLEAANLIATTSAGVHLGSANDAMLMGTTYRTQEQTMHSQLMTAMSTVATALTAASAAMAAASASHAVPVVGPITGAPMLATAATQLATAATAAAQVTAALAQFESSAALYLSTKNKLD